MLACSKEVMRRRPFLLGLVLLSSTLVAGAAVPALGGSKPPKVPGDITVPAGQKVVLDVVGKGVQIYHCKPGAADPSGRTWTFREPAAVLDVQRIETRGGMAPAGSCDPAKDSTIAVPYRARYVFYAG